MTEIYLLLFISNLLIPSLASFCGSAGVPFSFEVLPSGAPVLGCAQPSCVASPEGIKEDSNFLVNADGQSDGFLREKEIKRSDDNYANKLIANCSGKFADLTCPRKDQWVGGIEYIDHPRQPLILQCCTFAGLRFSQEVGVTNVGPGEAITGGEVIRDGRQISFDVIANARKVVDANTHVVSYEVTVRRMNCLPDPPEPVVDFEKGVTDEVMKVLTKATDRANFQKEKTLVKEHHESERGDKAFAATIQKVDGRKQRKKVGTDGKEHQNGNIPGEPQTSRTEQQAIPQSSSTESPVKFGSHFTNEQSARFTTAQPVPFTVAPPVLFTAAQPAQGSETLQVGSGGTAASGLPTAAGFDVAQRPLEFQAQGLGKPPEDVFGNREAQPPHVVPGSYSAPNQQVFGPYQPVSVGQNLQSGSDQLYRPCAIGCNQVSCGQQRCNEGRDPIFGFPTISSPFFPPFPLHFPTLAPHTLPTLPPFSATPAPHTFATLLPQTYPTVAPPFPVASGFLSPTDPRYAPAAFGSQTHVAPNAVNEIPGDTHSGGLAPLTFAPPVTAIPPSSSISSQITSTAATGLVTPIGSRSPASSATFAPLPSFDEFMARLGFRNITFATLPPVAFGVSTSTTPTSPLPLPTAGSAVVPETQQSPIQNSYIVSSPLQTRHDQSPALPVFYASQQWPPSVPDHSSNILPQAATYQQS